MWVSARKGSMEFDWIQSEVTLKSITYIRANLPGLCRALGVRVLTSSLAKEPVAKASVAILAVVVFVSTERSPVECLILPRSLSDLEKPQRLWLPDRSRAR